MKIVTNVVVQIIILLYLIDNNEQTSWMILMGSGVGVIIEAWKVASNPYGILCYPEPFLRSRRPLISALRPQPRVRGSHTAWTSKVTPLLYEKPITKLRASPQISMSSLKMRGRPRSKCVPANGL